MAVTPDGIGRSAGKNEAEVPPWFVDVGEPEPLMSTAELQAAIHRGEVPPGTLVWRLGMDSWVPFEDVEEIQPSSATEEAAREPPVARAAPSEREPDVPHDPHPGQNVPFDTDPASPPDTGNPELSGGEATGRGRPLVDSAAVRERGSRRSVTARASPATQAGTLCGPRCFLLAGEAGPPPHGPRHAACSSSPPDGRRTPLAPTRSPNSSPDAEILDTGSTEHGRMPLDTIPEDAGRAPRPTAHADHGGSQQDGVVEDRSQGQEGTVTAVVKATSLWRQPQSSAPPRPSLSPSAASRTDHAITKSSAEQSGSTRAATTLKARARPLAGACTPTGDRSDVGTPGRNPVSTAADGRSATAASAESDTADASNPKYDPIPSLRPTSPGFGSSSSPALDRSRSLSPSSVEHAASVKSKPAEHQCDKTQEENGERQAEHARMFPSNSPVAGRVILLPDAPTNPWQKALPPPAGADVSSESDPDAAAQPEPGSAQDVAAVVPGAENVTELRTADSVEFQESTGAQIETISAVRRKMDALRAHYLRVMVAVAVVAATVAAVVSALVVRRQVPAVQHSSVVQRESKAATAHAPTVANVGTGTTASVETLPTESPLSAEALPDQPESGRGDLALSRAAARHGAARPASPSRRGIPSVSASAADPSGDAQRVDSKSALDRSGLDEVDGQPRVRTAAASGSEPALGGTRPPEPASGQLPSTSVKSWKANDPGF